MRFTAATAPARRPSPSMIEASISISPSALKHEPRPALKSGESSRTTTAAVDGIQGGLLLIGSFQRALENGPLLLARLVAPHDAGAAVDCDHRFHQVWACGMSRGSCWVAAASGSKLSLIATGKWSEPNLRRRLKLTSRKCLVWKQ